MIALSATCNPEMGVKSVSPRDLWLMDAPPRTIIIIQNHRCALMLNHGTPVSPHWTFNPRHPAGRDVGPTLYTKMHNDRHFQFEFSPT